MPLKFDPEYQEELDRVRDDTLKIDQGMWWWRLIAYLAVLAASIFLLQASALDHSTKVLVMLAVCTACVIATVNTAVTIIHGTLTILIAATEWVGRKQLGEYQEPD